MKLPGIYAAYALIMAVFGESHLAIHLGLLIANAATALLLFLLGRRLLNGFAGLTTAGAFALLSLGQQVDGVFANAEHFVILPAVGGLLLLVRAVEFDRWLALFAASVLLGLSFVTKQHGVAFIILGGTYLLVGEVTRRPFRWNKTTANGMIFLCGVALPYALTCLILLKAGVFEKFWFWTFTYAREYASSSLPISVGIDRLTAELGIISTSALVIWLIAAVGLTALAWNRKRLRDTLFPLLFLLFSLAAVVPGYHFRSHYFVMLLPAIALLAGIGASSIRDLLRNYTAFPAISFAPALLVLFALLHGLWQQRDFLLAEPEIASRMNYGLNPFPESLEVARFINENSHESDQIAVIGSEPQIYFYSKRRSATGHLYTYALMESQPYARVMQEEMIREIESVKPKFMVFVNVQTSWLQTAKSDKHIFKWFNSYRRNHYELAGIAQISPDGTQYAWNEEVKNFLIKPGFWLAVFRRKN